MKLHTFTFFRLLPVAVCLLGVSAPGGAQPEKQVPGLGPYNGVFIADGLGIPKPMDTERFSPKAGRPWSMVPWVNQDTPLEANSLLAGIGDPMENSTYLGVAKGKLAAWVGSQWISSSTAWVAGQWHLGALTFDGATLRL